MHQNSNISKIATVMTVGFTAFLSLVIHNVVNAQGVINRSVQGFPWKDGETWKYSQDLHGSVNNALDFGTPNGTPADVYSVDDGVVHSVNDCTIIVKRSDGLYIGYHHVTPSPEIIPKKSVSYQTKLGTTSLCGTSTGHHLHFWMHDESTADNHKKFNLIGFNFGDWQLTKERDFNEVLKEGADPISGYDYVLRNGSTVACAGSTTQEGKDICTTNSLLHQKATTTPSKAPSVSGLKTYFVGNFALNTNKKFVRLDGFPIMSSWTKNYNDSDQQLERLPGKFGFLLKHKSTGGCLNAHYLANGSQMNVFTPCNTGDIDQNWTFPDLGDGYFQIKRADSNSCVDMRDRSDGGKIHLWECDANNSNQRWRTN